MKNKYVKIAVFTALGLGVAFGGYKLYTFIKNKKALNDGAESIESESDGVSLPSFDENKEVKVGSVGSEVKTIQMALNNIIDDAKKSNPTTGDSETRRKAVANLTKLKLDGIFGAKTFAVTQKIMGANSTTYAKVRQKRLDFAKAYGLGNPYQK